MSPVVQGRPVTVSLAASKALLGGTTLSRCLVAHHSTTSRRGSYSTFSSASTSTTTTRTIKPSFTLNTPTRRHIQTTKRKEITIAIDDADVPSAETGAPNRAPLSVLPLSTILRSLMTNTVSASPLLLGPSLRIMQILAHSENMILNPDRNPILRFFLKSTFYAQFCAGENGKEVGQTITGLKNIGFSGVILCYAKEVVLSEAQAAKLGSANLGEETPEIIKSEIIPWAEGTLETVRLVQPGDHVALKFTGAGRLALHCLQNRLDPTPQLYKSIDAICQLAKDRGVNLLFDAEQDMLQDGIDDWTMHFAKKYNTASDVVVYGTYQSYKKNCPEVLSKHLAQARDEGFALGVKLVRGAYLGSDPRSCFWDTKQQTDECFDGLASAVLSQQYSSMLPGSGAFPHSALVLATHNAESVRRARAICDAGAAKSSIAFAQLQGMADEVSCELVEASHSPERKGSAVAASPMPTFKYLVWGTTGECMKYLLRRAQENKDAVGRTKTGRDAMFYELIRRCKTVVGLA